MVWKIGKSLLPHRVTPLNAIVISHVRKCVMGATPMLIVDKHENGKFYLEKIG